MKEIQLNHKLFQVVTSTALPFTIINASRY